MESEEHSPKKALLETSKDKIQDFFRDANAIIVQTEEEKQQQQGQQIYNEFGRGRGGRGGGLIICGGGGGGGAYGDHAVINVPGLVEEACATIFPDLKSKKHGTINFKMINNNHAHICYFYIDSTKSIFDNCVKNPFYTMGSGIRKELIDFIACLDLLSQTLLERKYENVNKIIFTQIVSSYEIWNQCKKELECFAQKMKERKIKVYCCVSENRCPPNLGEMYG